MSEKMSTREFQEALRNGELKPTNRPSKSIPKVKRKEYTDPSARVFVCKRNHVSRDVTKRNMIRCQHTGCDWRAHAVEKV